MTFLHGNKFDPSTVMPICLPSSQDFNDTERQATAVGMGVSRSIDFKDFKDEKPCFTDGSGPEVFQRCAPYWVDDRYKKLDSFGKYRTTKGCFHGDPPSTNDEICKSFHEKIKSIG